MRMLSGLSSQQSTLNLGLRGVEAGDDEVEAEPSVLADDGSAFDGDAGVDGGLMCGCGCGARSTSSMASGDTTRSASLSPPGSTLEPFWRFFFSCSSRVEIFALVMHAGVGLACLCELGVLGKR